jgi:hypothetical protein
MIGNAGIVTNDRRIGSRIQSYYYCFHNYNTRLECLKKEKAYFAFALGCCRFLKLLHYTQLMITNSGSCVSLFWVLGF